MKKFLVLVFFLVSILGGLHLTVNFYLQKKVNLESTAIVEIQRGATLTKMASRLAEGQLIDYPRLFVKVGQFYGYDQRLKYGEYLIEPTDSYRDLFNKITSGKIHRYNVTFVEGDHMYRYAEIVEEKGLCKAESFLKWAKDPSLIKTMLGENLKSFEGYLFPETYSFSKADGCKVIVTTMVRNFLKFTKGVIPRNQKLSRHEIVTLASIVEKETGAAVERPRISSVFHNRMKKRMRLQTDPTIIYGILDETGKEIRNIRKKDIRRPTVYNTYVIKGLPPGPIANPGLEAIEAAVSPDTTPYLYFVSQNDGTHIFTKNYKDHLKAVKMFQLNPKARQGKSWRDLKNKKVK